MLKPAKLPTPKPGAGQILVKVAAAGVNRPDVQQRIGAYPPPPGHSPLPGPGDRRRGGGDRRGRRPLEGGRQGVRADERRRLCASTASPRSRQRCRSRRGSTWFRPAAVPETFFTVWNNVFERGRLEAGEWFLVHGGTSGIGTTAIQLAKAFGARVLATAGSADKCKACLDLGADQAINYRTEDFVAAVKEATGGKGVDVTLDMVGGDYTERNIVAPRPRTARIVQIATLGGADVKFNISPADGEARHADRLDAAAAHPRGEGRLRAGAGEQGLAADRRGQVKVVMDSDVPARQGRQTRTAGSRPASTSARSC